MKNGNCEYCDGPLEQAVKRVPFPYKKETTYIDNVPVRVCDDAEIYCEAEFYKKLEKIAATRPPIKSQVPFQLMDYRVTDEQSASDDILEIAE